MIRFIDIEETPRLLTALGRVPKSALGAGALTLILHTSGALAGPIAVSDYVNDNQIGTVDIDFPDEVKNVFDEGYDSIRVSFSASDTSLLEDLWVWAGAFGGEATAVDGDPFNPSTLYRSEDDVVLYCVDLFEDLNQSETRYNVLTIDDNTEVTETVKGVTVTRDFGNLLDFLSALNWVLGSDTYGYDLDYGDRNWLNPNDWQMSGAIQVGIWESLYDTDMDLSDGSFTVSDKNDNGWRLSDAGQTLLSRTFYAMSDEQIEIDPIDSSLILWFQTDEGQDLIGDPVAPVPAPGTLALMLGGLLFLGNVGGKIRENIRRRRPNA